MEINFATDYTGITITGDPDEAIPGIDREDYERWKLIAECNRVVGANVTDVQMISPDGTRLTMSFAEFEELYGGMF